MRSGPSHSKGGMIELEFRIEVDIFEPRHLDQFGPAGCNHCGGIVSESLVQLLATIGVEAALKIIVAGSDNLRAVMIELGEPDYGRMWEVKRLYACFRIPGFYNVG